MIVLSVIIITQNAETDTLSSFSQSQSCIVHNSIRHENLPNADIMVQSAGMMIMSDDDDETLAMVAMNQAFFSSFFRQLHKPITYISYKADQ